MLVGPYAHIEIVVAVLVVDLFLFFLSQLLRVFELRGEHLVGFFS